MTLSTRNSFFKGGIILAALSLGLVAAAGYFAFPAFPASAVRAVMRPEGITQWFISAYTEPAAYVPFWTMLGAALYSLTSIILIHYFFEKTQSPEILFFGFFVISLSFECVRIIIPLKQTFPFPGLYLISASRVLLFGRYFGLFSLFAASVYAAGLDVQKQQNAFIILVMAALVIAAGVPVDSLVWDTSLKMLSGYSAMFILVEIGIAVITMITFFVSAYTRGSRDYVFIGIGAFLVFAGRNILITSDTWISPVPGILILAAGTWFICDRLHQIYLWL
jgi:hypothetical protein